MIDRKYIFVSEFNQCQYINYKYLIKSIPLLFSALKEQGLVQINGKSFLYPNSPILLQPKEVRRDMVCQVGEENRHQEPQCIHILNAMQGEVIEIALINEGIKYLFELWSKIDKLLMFRIPRVRRFIQNISVKTYKKLFCVRKLVYTLRGMLRSILISFKRFLYTTFSILSHTTLYLKQVYKKYQANI